MMKQEFETLVKQEVSSIQYNVIECVYMFHPAIDSKNTIAKIFLMKEGYSIICDMYPRASKLEDIEKQISEKNAEISKLREQAATFSKPSF